MHAINEAPNLFYIGDSPDDCLAHIEYKIQGNILTIFHTIVSDTLKGQGIGQQLVSYAVDFARKNGYTVNPVCPYASSQFARNPGYGDILSSG